MSQTFNLIKKFYKNYQQKSSYIYQLALLLIPIGLLFSRALLSIGFLLFIFNWFIEGQFKLKWQYIKHYKAEILICFIFLIHIVGMINTENIDFGLKDLKIKLPLLLPFFFGSAISLHSTFKSSSFINVFAISTIAASLTGYLNFEYFLKFQTVDDLRNITFMAQNIMLSLFVNFSIFICITNLMNNWKKSRIHIKLLLLASIAWLINFLYLLNSLTGYFTFGFLLLFSMFYIPKSIRKMKIVALLLFTIFISGIVLIVYINNVVDDFYKKETVNVSKLSLHTLNGNEYIHNLDSRRTENGYYIDLYVCNEELEKEWSKLSSMEILGKDKKGQVLSETLRRYLTSKGLRKDSAGLNQLKKEEIGYIENGCTNYKYLYKYSLESRIYNILWQINTYKTTGNASAQSISQRIEFLKSALYLINTNFWFGVGSGDVMDTFHKTLEKLSPNLEAQYRNRVHNQYIVEFVALGIFGFSIFIFLIFYPIFRIKIWKTYLFAVFYLIILISFLTDNPLETQLGVSFFSYFYCLFAFKNRDSKSMH